MRVEQTHQFLVDVLRDTLSGDIAVAGFQRPYVWNSEQVEAMFTSILRGWPMGSFMTWQPSGDVDMAGISRGRIGPLLSNGNEDTLLLDGQNRLATLAWASAADGSEIQGDGDWSPAEKATWMSGRVLCADYELKRVLFVPAGEEATGNRIPVRDILTSLSGGRGYMAAIDRLFKAGGSDDAIRWFFDELSGQIREARVTVTSLRRADLAEAREAFLHICRVGQPISAEDFEAAVNWTQPPRP